MSFGHKSPNFGPLSLWQLAMWQKPGAAEPQPFVMLCVCLRNAIHFAGLAYSTFNVTRIWHVQFCASALFGQIELKN